MAKRFADTEIWKKQWFRELSPTYKAFWRYICDNCDNSGVWEVDVGLAGFQIGDKIDYDKILSLFSENIVEISKDKWFLPSFIRFQYGKLSKDCKPHTVVFNLLDKHGIDINTIEENDKLRKLSISRKTKMVAIARAKERCAYCQKHLSPTEFIFDHVVPESEGGDDEINNIVLSCYECNSKKSNKPLDVFLKENFIDHQRVLDRVLNTLLDKEKEKDKDKEEEKDKENSEIVEIIELSDLDRAMSDFAEMRRRIRKPLTDRGAELIRKKLESLSPDEKTQVSILEQSIANSWQGVFPLQTAQEARQGTQMRFGRRPATTAEIVAQAQRVRLS
jgi:hypothetical protein